MVWSKKVGFEETEADTSVCSGDQVGGFVGHDGGCLNLVGCDGK